MRTHSRMQRGDAMRARIVVRVFLIIFSTRYLYCIKKCQTLYKSRRILLNHLMFFPYTELSLNCKNLKNTHQF